MLCANRATCSDVGPYTRAMGRLWMLYGAILAYNVLTGWAHTYIIELSLLQLPPNLVTMGDFKV